MANSSVVTYPSPMTESILRDRDYTIIMAQSLANPVAPPPGFAQRWLTAQSCIIDLAQKCAEFDPDGITLYVAQQTPTEACAFQRYEPITVDTFETLVGSGKPPQAVQLAPGLQMALDDYFQQKDQGTAKANGQIILVLMDGEPKDRMAIANLIVKATHQLEADHELGIGLVQIGENPIAQGFFEMLDDSLEEAGAKFDIVHTKILSTIESDSLATFLLDTLID
ncbi:MAG: hypothetical protein F6K30_17125 [Cyanothece sp. SIO2G6]|nr:hypothetical protein [Cyanothece sp. SIO2G6]